LEGKLNASKIQAFDAWERKRGLGKRLCLNLKVLNTELEIIGTNLELNKYLRRNSLLWLETE
jgi:hypothetical protein